MSEFNVLRDRDAWFVIRGYKYQIDLSILRWLSLDKNEILVLEFGEDIDIVNNSVVKGLEDFDRVLEQVKHLDKPITLRSNASKVAISNAIQHLNVNPATRILFRFCTNSSYTTERPSPFQDRQPGIEIWEKLRLKKIPEPEFTERLTQLLGFLRSLKNQPEGIDLDSWKHFRIYILNASLDDLIKLINSFQWATQELGIADISDEIFNVLHHEKKVSLDRAKNLYPRLFVSVIQLLSQKGEKVLDANLLDEVLSYSELSQEDSKLLDRLNSQVLLQSIQLEQHDQAINRHEESIQNIQEKMLEDRYGIQLSVALSTAIADISTSLPPQVKTISERRANVLRIKSYLTNNDWLAIYGSVGSGKTQLTTLLGDHLESVIYVSLRDLSSDEANFLLYHLFLQICGNEKTGTVTESGLIALEPGTVIFLDDVPRLVSGDQLSRRILKIADNLLPRSQRLVTVSHHSIPSSIQDMLKNSRFYEIVTPSLDREDTKELFIKYGAPENILSDQIVDSFAQSTSGNPTILAAIAKTIKSKGWRFLDTYRAQVAESSTKSGFVEETMFRLLKTVESQESRELLYRLCVVLGAFGNREVNAVASVAPMVNRPGEAFSHLEGLWVEKHTENVAVLCPLISTFGANQLNAEVKENVADTLAELIVSGDEKTPIEFAKAIHYLKIAKNGVNLGAFLLSGLKSSIEFPLVWKKLILEISLTNGLLDDCPHLLKILIKTMQIHLAASMKKSVMSLVTQANELIKKTNDEDYWAVFAYSIQVSTIVAKENFEEGIKLGTFVLSHIEEFKKVEEDYRNVVDSKRYLSDELVSSFPWFFISELKNERDFEVWFKMIASQTVDLVSSIFSSDLAREGLRFSLDLLWLNQSKVSEKNRRFKTILSIYDKVIDYSVENGFPLVEALAIRSKIIVYAEFLNDMDGAQLLADVILESKQDNDEVKFLINHIIGRQYLYTGQIQNARDKLTTACDLNIETFRKLYCQALVDLSRAIGDENSAEALKKMELAIQIGKVNEQEISNFTMIELLGEASIAAWFNNDKKLAYLYLQDSFSLLFNYFEETYDWKIKQVLLEQTLGYMASMASTGRPPHEDYVEPKRGFLLIDDNKELVDWYEQTSGMRSLATDAFLLVIFSEAVQMYDRAVYWANKGIDNAREMGFLPSIAQLGETLIPTLIKQSLLEQALDYANESSMAIVASNLSTRQNGMQAVFENNDPLTILGTKPNEYWNEVENYSLFLGVIPILLYLFVSGDRDEENLKMLSTYCDSQSNDASDPEIFLSVSKAIELFLEEGDGKEFEKLGGEAFNNGYRAGAMANFILASFMDSTDLRHSVVLHTLMMWEYSSLVRPNASLWLFLTEELQAFWLSMFKVRKFSFCDLFYVEKSLSQLNDSSVEIRVKKLLQVIMTGLRVKLPHNYEAVSKWIET